MTTEKLAEGFRTALDATEPHPYTHRVFRDFLELALGNRQIQARFGKSRRAYRDFIRYTAKPLAEAIQNLSPEGDTHPNPEYPWSDTQGNVVSPLDYPFGELDTRANPKMLEMLAFVEACLEIAQAEV
ncbi:MAG: hypothetical protein H7Y38_08410 [Armatimonadetes bacterium]|nr:hypothetical protein [Armatimonadota bacterium]